MQRVAKKYILTCDELLNDRFSWGIAWKFNRKYNMMLSKPELYSEIASVYLYICNQMKKEKLKFGWDDYNQGIRYFRQSVIYKFCDLVQELKKKGLKEIPVSNLDLDTYNYNREPDSTMIKVICSITDENIFKYILKLKEKDTAHKLLKVYKKFGVAGIGLILKCKWAVNIKQRRCKMVENDEIMKFSRNEIEWIEHILGDTLKDCNDTETGNVIVEYAMKQNNGFWRRAIKWVMDGMKIDESDKCFSDGYSTDVNICKGCVVSLECKKALDWKLSVRTKEEVDKIKDLEESNDSITKIVTKTEKGTNYVTNTKPKIYISSIKKEPYSCTSSVGITSWLEERNIEYRTYADKTIGCKLTYQQLFEVTEKFKKG